jgi:hypothetical protein
MIKELLIKVAKGNNSITGLSMELNLDPVDVRDRLDMLAHLGYLKRIDTCPPNKNKKVKSNDNTNDKSNNHTPDDQFECKHCLLSNSCKETHNDRVTELIGYSLTKKGKKYLKQL